MWEQSRVEAKRDERVWRGGGIGVLLGGRRREEWFLLEWVPVEIGGKLVSKQQRKQLERLGECFHDGCGFMNCTMFCEYLGFRTDQTCGVCRVTRRNWRYWSPVVRMGRRWWWWEDEYASRACGPRGCWDERVDWEEYGKMKRLPGVVRV